VDECPPCEIVFVDTKYFCHPRLEIDLGMNKFKIRVCDIEAFYSMANKSYDGKIKSIIRPLYLWVDEFIIETTIPEKELKNLPYILTVEKLSSMPLAWY
jgi:hypothetical protein